MVELDLKGNPLSATSIKDHIPILQNRGVRVEFPWTPIANDDDASIAPSIYNNNLFVLPVTENLIDFSDKAFPLEDYAQRFYDYFDDEFDFLVFIPNYFASYLFSRSNNFSTLAFYKHVSNDVKGIGLGHFSDASEFGSEGKLQGVIQMWYFARINDPSTPTELFAGPFLHEIMHRWGNYIIGSDSHWPFSNINGHLGGFSNTDIVDHGKGRYSASAIPRDHPYGPLELYLAGLIPPEDVPDIWIAYGERKKEWHDDYITTTITANQVRTYTIEDIIAEHGPRIPDHTQSQKNFRVAVILLVGRYYPADKERLDWLSRDVTLMSREGPPDPYQEYNFYEATGGRATLIMDGLSSFKRQGAAKRLVPSSFGTPPPPIVDHWE